MEHWAKLNSERLRSNGYLGGWVAAKALIGELDDAWSKAVSLYDRKSDWQLIECTVPEVKGVCPQGLERTVDFLFALRKYLETNGYIRGRPSNLNRLHLLQLYRMSPQHHPTQLHQSLRQRQSAVRQEPVFTSAALVTW